MTTIPNSKDFSNNVKRAGLRVINKGHYKDGEKVFIHKFTSDWIKKVVADDIKKGDYRIGLLNNGSFNVCYVGRATDQKLQDRLLQHTNPNDDHYFDESYYFTYNAARTEDEAINQECIDYHSFGGDDNYLENKYHPSLPDGKQCPWESCDHKGGEQ